MGCEKRKEEALLFTASESEASEEERTLIYLTHSESADSFTNRHRSSSGHWKKFQQAVLMWKFIRKTLWAV